MRVAIGSMFRNAADYLPGYLDQVRALQAALEARGDSLRLIAAEGDSVDRTWELLWSGAEGLDAELFQCHHGGPVYGSVVLPERFAQMAYVQNAVISRVCPEDDAFIYVEGDLWWEPATMLQLLDDLSAERPIVAPMAMHHTGRFYDSWGYRLDGQHFAYFPPYHPSLNGSPLVRLDTAGSCLVMLGKVARSCRFQPEDCIVGLCRDAAQRGYSVWLDQRVAVTHPPDGAD